eukprot:4541511-Alexandrium_andersonii.AAC.1
MNDNVDAVCEARADTHPAPVGLPGGHVAPGPSKVARQPAHLVSIVCMLVGTIGSLATLAIVPIGANSADGLSTA